MSVKDRKMPIRFEIEKLSEKGLTQGQIAQKLNITRGSVAGHRYRNADLKRLGRWHPPAEGEDYEADTSS